MSKDAVEAAPSVYRVLFENERVRLLEGRVRPGESSGMHAHPDGLVFVLQGGKVAITDASGARTEVEIPSGAIRWRDAHEHAGENLDGQDFVALFFEPK
jgi:hypothetical protein